jgi:hypothetical protein
MKMHYGTLVDKIAIVVISMGESILGLWICVWDMCKR